MVERKTQNSKLKITTYNSKRAVAVQSSFPSIKGKGGGFSRPWLLHFALRF
jgi:hypothetical protein